jgi:hypothetical protein
VDSRKSARDTQKLKVRFIQSDTDLFLYNDHYYISGYSLSPPFENPSSVSSNKYESSTGTSNNIMFENFKIISEIYF